MGKVHVVARGDHASSIAARNGYATLDPVWDAKGNDSLRSSRRDPHQLVPGDRVVVPTAKITPVKRATGATHTFRVTVERLKLRLKVLDLLGRPVASESIRLVLNGEEQELTTDADGVVVVPVPRDCHGGRIEFFGRTHQLEIGALSPIAGEMGISDRLANLGYWYGAADDDPAAQQLAIELFQNEHDMMPSGVVDEAVQKARRASRARRRTHQAAHHRE
jgi:hypothetical protein